MTSRRVGIALIVVAVAAATIGVLGHGLGGDWSFDAGGSGSIASFARDTWIATGDGAVRIEEIAAGDLVHTYDVDNKRWELHEVIEVMPAYYDYTYLAFVTIGTDTIRASAHHPVYVTDGDDLATRKVDAPRSSTRNNREGWVRAGDLQPGDKVITMDSDEAEVTAVYTDTASILLFDLVVDGTPNFAVGVSRLLVGDQTLVPEEEFAPQVTEYSGGGGCFPAGTQVATSSGFQGIETIQVGTTVRSYDVLRQSWLANRVSEVQVQTYAGTFVTIESTAGGVESTVNHPIMVLSGENLHTRPHPSDVPASERITDGTAKWVEAGDIRIGDVLLGVGGFPTTVVSVSVTERSASVYNITVEPSHTYLVGSAGIVVHNKAAAESAGSGGYAEEEAFGPPEPEPSSAPMAADEATVMEKSSAEPADSGAYPPESDDDRSQARDSQAQTEPDQLFLSTDDSNSTASPAIVRSIIESGRYVPPEIIRTYEFYNYYSFGYPGPEEGDLGIFANLRHAEGAASTTSTASTYNVQAVLRGPDRSMADLPPLNVVFLLDVSGSMAGSSWDIARQFVYRFIGKLRTGDTIALVTVSRYSQVVIDQYQVNAGTADYVRSRIDSIVPNDITNLDPGIEAAYNIAERFHRYRGLTRVVLVSDGGANAGDFSGNTITHFAEDAERQGVYLTGVGVGNGFNDGLMNSLTDSGRGAYFFLDRAEEIDHILDQFVSYFDLAYKDVRLGMQMPSGWSVRAFHGEQMSTVREEIVPQYLAPNDQMIFHMVLEFAGGTLRRSDEFTFEAEYTPIGQAPRLATRAFTVQQMLNPSNQLLKADIITVFAEGLKRIEFPLMENRIANLAVWNEVLAEIRKGQDGLADGDITEILALATKYQTILSEGEQFPDSLDRTRSDIPAVLGLSDDAVVSVETDGPATNAAIQDRSRLRESILLQPMEGYRFLGLSSGPVGNPYPVGSGELSSSQFTHPVAEFMGNAKYYMNRSAVYDLHQIVLELQAPQEAMSFSFDFNFFSAEYPDFVNQSFNDSFYAILEAQSTNNGRPTNISFDPEQNPIEVDNNYFQRRFHPIANTGTGFDNNGSTGWLRTSWPIRGGERFTITFTVHDEGDAIYDSMAILDNFQWHDYPAIGNTDPLN